jgi:hypothetical protein
MRAQGVRHPACAGLLLTAMAKLLLLSIVIAIIALPAKASGVASPRAGLRKALIWMAVFNIVYLFSVMYVYPRL